MGTKVEKVFRQSLKKLSTKDGLENRAEPIAA
jgi:hypothetical protein